MIIEAFLHWKKKAGTRERARAASALARAYLESQFTAEDQKAAEAVIITMVDDPAPQVRLALAEALSFGIEAPRAAVLALAHDQIEVASRIIPFSPVPEDSDLIDLLADGDPARQRLIAMRHGIPVSVSAALIEIGNSLAIADLLDNASASIATVSLRRAAERFGHIGLIRRKLLQRCTLPSDVRHVLMMEVSHALSRSGFVSRVVGIERIRRVADEACQQATLHLASSGSAQELPALIAHIRMAGRLTPGFLFHALCAGHIDVFAALIAHLARLDGGHVRSLLVDGRYAAMVALYRKVGIGERLCPVFVSATLLWRNAMSRGLTLTPQIVARKLMEEFCDPHSCDPAVADLMDILRQHDHDHARVAARDLVNTLMQAA